jgi:hypothetical protein
LTQQFGELAAKAMKDLPAGAPAAAPAAPKPARSGEEGAGKKTHAQMSTFRSGHAAHSDWRMALTAAAAQIDAQPAAAPPTLGWCYFTDAYAAQAEPLLAALRARWPGVDWVGCVGVGVAASGVEHFDEPALVLMLSSLPRDAFEVFSGARPLSRIAPFSRPGACRPGNARPAGADRRDEPRVESGYLFGGSPLRAAATLTLADGVWQGGLSGVAFTRDTTLISRVTQGSQPSARCARSPPPSANVVLELDGQPALPLLLADLGIADLDNPRQALPKLRATLVGLSDATEALLGRGGQFGTDTRVRHLIGLDPGPACLRHCRRGRTRHAPGLLPARRGRRAARPGAHLQRDPRGGGRNPARTPPCPAPPTDPVQRIAGRDLRQLLGPRRAAFRRPVGRNADRAPCPGRRAAGRVLCRRRDRAPPSVWVYGGADGVCRALKRELQSQP